MSKRWIKDAVRVFPPGRGKTALIPGKDRPKRKGNGKYLKGAEAHARNRRINILHQCGLSSVAIAPHVKVTPARVRQILEAHEEKLYVTSFMELQHIQQQAFNAATVPLV